MFHSQVEKLNHVSQSGRKTEIDNDQIKILLENEKNALYDSRDK